MFCKKNTLSVRKIHFQFFFSLLSPLPFIIVSEVLYRTFLSSREKEKVIFTGNEVKISLVLDGMILYFKNLENSQEKNTKDNKFSKVEKFNIMK